MIYLERLGEERQCVNCKKEAAIMLHLKVPGSHSQTPLCRGCADELQGKLGAIKNQSYNLDPRLDTMIENLSRISAFSVCIDETEEGEMVVFISLNSDHYDTELYTDVTFKDDGTIEPNYLQPLGLSEKDLGL